MKPRKILRELTGNTFIKNWKKQKIDKQNIIEHYATTNSFDTDVEIENENAPYIDISIGGNSVVKSSQFRLSLCRNRLFELKITDPSPYPELQLQSRPSYDELENGNANGNGNGYAPMTSYPHTT